MHLKLTKHGRFYEKNNQLPTKSHDELKDNSIGRFVFKYENNMMSHYIEDVHAIKMMHLIVFRLLT